MYFYVDESGHTGPNIFDEQQPMLYYGSLSSRINLDLVARTRLEGLRSRLGVSRLHANDLGNAGLAAIGADLHEIQRRFDLRFDVFRVAKPDHAVICFFDQVFDQAMNPAMTWTGYWTPLRYMLLIKVAMLFDEDLAKQAWAARIDIDARRAGESLINVCDGLLRRLDMLPDPRSRQLVGDVLTWARNHPADISYNVSDKKAMLQVTPNIIGFQLVMLRVAAMIKKSGRQAAKIIVDRQSQFNKSQRTLAEFYASAADKRLEFVGGPGMPVLNFKSMPTIPIEFSGGDASPGLELADIYLWTFKRAIEEKEIPPELHPFLGWQVRRARTDEVSLNAIAKRWTQYFKALPELDEMSPAQVSRAQEILSLQERRRLEAIVASTAATRGD
jgi:hypothetical protein